LRANASSCGFEFVYIAILSELRKKDLSEWFAFRISQLLVHFTEILLMMVLCADLL
jgi:hypothetical protein